MSSHSRRRKSFLLAMTIGASALLPSLAPAQDGVILQYFEGRWETIERRMPDIFMSGYSALWLPPPSRADSGNFSVGYDVFDRFDLGSEDNPTLYGTEAGVRRLVREANRAGILVYFDAVFNHNGFSDGQRGNLAGENCSLRWAINEGGYPGFVMSGRDLGLPFNLEFRDICGSSINCNTDPLNCRISGLIDINHDTNYQWIRHPAEPGNPANIPYQENRVRPENRRLYPDPSLPFVNGRPVFNLDDPMAGEPVTENVNQMLQRWTRWMMESVGADGFRLDAVKHTPVGWFNNIYDEAVLDGAIDFWGRRRTPFSFGELISGSNAELAPYHRRDGFGNRTVLDFPLKFAMNGNLGNPSGSLANLLTTTADTLTDGLAQNGSAGVMFVQSHDNGPIGDPPPFDNIAHAHILSRKGTPIVYFNALEFGTGRDFPNRGRGDALGQFGNTITRMVEINNNFVARRSGNDYRNLWADSDYIAYELNNTLVALMSDRDDRGSSGLGWEERPLSNFGFRGVTLVELTGNADNPLVDPAGDIPSTIIIPADVSPLNPVTVRVPTNQNAAGVRHGRSYLMYSLLPPQGLDHGNAAGDVGLRLVNRSTTLPADGSGAPASVARRTAVDVVTGSTAVLELQIDQSAGSLEDNALIKWNHGINIDGDDSGPFGIRFGIDDPLVAGFENFTSRSVSMEGGTGTYSIEVDLTNPDIPEGYNYVTALAFLERNPGLPPLFTTFRKVIYVDRRGPDAELVFPANPTGVGDVGSPSFEFVLENPDATANSVHFFWNLPEETNPITAGLLNDSNRGRRSDRARWRFTVNDMVPGAGQSLTVVLFEETGNSTIARFEVGVDFTGDHFLIF